MCTDWDKNLRDTSVKLSLKEFIMDKNVLSQSAVKDIRRRNRKKYSSEEKIRIVIYGLRDEDSISSLCRREGIPSNLNYRW